MGADDDNQSGGHVSDGVDMDNIEDYMNKVEVGQNVVTGVGNNTYQHYQPQKASLAGQKRTNKASRGERKEFLNDDNEDSYSEDQDGSEESIPYGQKNKKEGAEYSSDENDFASARKT